MKKYIFTTMIALVAVATGSSAFAGDCRLKIISNFDVVKFADVDTFATAAKISETAQDRRHGFDLSNDRDAPYTLEYTISAKAGSKVGYLLSFKGQGMSVQSNSSIAANTGREKKQAKLYAKVVNDLLATIPACPYR